ncbi:MAG: glycosyltransferase [Solirubrobacterales bacterium]|nr:glycosyltransferase [Solirubrobacterales bacterium]
MRPPVSVVVPFAGDAVAASAALDLLRSLRLAPQDELILADNCGAVGPQDDVNVIRADGERSPAHARNVGAAAAVNDWILFLDADTHAPADLLERFFPVADRVGAVTGDIRGYVSRPTLAARYGASRNFLGQRSHLAHYYKPRVAAAVLLVRTAAFRQVGGFVEGVRAAEDTDFSWRLQEAGWELDFRPDAVVEHQYRESLSELRRQWRGYAAGARWLESRWPGYHPDPGLNRLARILLKRFFGVGPGVGVRADGHAAAARLGRAERLRFFLVQCVLGIEEQIGLRMSNEAK